ncbi:MAG: hypothetical protein M3169_01465, partial [Candidatus Eremiobacteraeota bacterium]|nr:hypothetical protein [Candidatus Eremiobacteraeota bacterium]
MNVPSYEFLGFAAAVAAAINLSSASLWRRAVLLVANLLFIVTFTRDPAQLAPFAALLLLGFAGMKLLERRKSRALLWTVLGVVLIVFCALKRYTFVPGALTLPFVYFTVGMSYVFFRVLHLVIDAYQEALPERVGFLSYANYTLNFTALVSGPIQFYRDYRRNESVEPSRLDAAAASHGAKRIIIGFFKVSALSPLLLYAHGHAVIALSVASPLGERVVDASVATAAFPLFLYFNFSGYTDVVIGVARFLRFELPENFNKPFSARGFIDFWGRWHMTLSNWMKTYVYSPLLLGLMRRYPSRSVEPLLGTIAYFVAFFSIGLWHGQTSMFVCFGVLLGLGVSINKLYQTLMIARLGRPGYRALTSQPLYAAGSCGLTLTYFAFATLWFWSS